MLCQVIGFSSYCTEPVISHLQYILASKARYLMYKNIKTPNCIETTKSHSLKFNRWKGYNICTASKGFLFARPDTSISYQGKRSTNYRIFLCNIQCIGCLMKHRPNKEMRKNQSITKLSSYNLIENYSSIRTCGILSVGYRHAILSQGNEYLVLPLRSSSL